MSAVWVIWLPFTESNAQKMLSWRIVNDERTLTGIHLNASGPTERPREHR